MNLEELKNAIRQMEETQRAADDGANLSARMIVGRLRHVYPSLLSKLKKELRQYNMNTGRWMDSP